MQVRILDSQDQQWQYAIRRDSGMAFVYERLYNRLNIIAMETTSMFIAHPSSIINLIDRDDGKKKQTLEKAPSVAFV